ncbi:tyrosine-protein phosphatase non-receptor type substrate 1-like, partial [Latimeria chalumnae]|uniref:tyrosine-protein phosphatase non-receptor type substrate 1-like n=1 Tax=Latimeria chalumnae TaxID=7897 RepID=UPI00313D5746
LTGIRHSLIDVGSFNGSSQNVSLKISSVTLSDTGTYYCEVKIFLKKIADGKGQYLIVYAPPSFPNIIVSESILSNDFLFSVTCTSSGFYPEKANFTWFRNGVEVLSNISTKTESSGDGTFSISSNLQQRESSSTTAEVVYSCKLSHISLQLSLTANITARIPDPRLWIKWAYVPAVGVMLFLISPIFYFCYWRRKREEPNSRNIKSTEEKGKNVAERGLLYTTIHHDSKKRKTEKINKNLEHTVYAEIQRRY